MTQDELKLYAEVEKASKKPKRIKKKYQPFLIARNKWVCLKWLGVDLEIDQICQNIARKMRGKSCSMLNVGADKKKGIRLIQREEY